MTSSLQQRCGRGRAYPFAVTQLCLWSLLDTGEGAIAADKPAKHTIVIEGTKYEPESLTVKPGDTVVWINKDPFPHTVTAKGIFDSHDLAAGHSWKYRARKTGQFDYICTLHPNMKGALKVE